MELFHLYCAVKVTHPKISIRPVTERLVNERTPGLANERKIIETKLKRFAISRNRVPFTLINVFIGMTLLQLMDDILW